MVIIKTIILILILLTSSMIGITIASKYKKRENELNDIKQALNMFKTKIKYTYEPIPDIFSEMSGNFKANVSNLFRKSTENMKSMSAGEAWTDAVDTTFLNITTEDKNVLKSLSKMLRQNRCRRADSRDRINRQLFKHSNRKGTNRNKKE